MIVSQESCVFAMIVGREIPLFASPRVTVRKPLQLGLNLAKPQNSARETLSNDPNCVGTRSQHSFFPFDHAVCPDFTSCAPEFGPPVRFKLRGKQFLRTFLLP
jgi:hypothetical protein